MVRRREFEALKAHYDFQLAENDRLHDVIAGGLVAFPLTREYVGEDVLPAIDGWSWFDWTKRAEAALRGDHGDARAERAEDDG